MGCFLSIQQESSLSRLCLGHSTETPRPYLQLFEKVKPIRLNRTKNFFFFPVSVSLRFNSTDWKRDSAGEEESRVRGTANGEQGRGSNRKLGNGERKRRKWTAGHWKKKQRRRRLPVEEQLSTWIKPATGKASTIFISHFPGAAHAELDTQG